MSLDVYLTMSHKTEPSEPSIYIRKDGSTVKITRKEWDELYPNQEPFTVNEEDNCEVFWANITHNLNEMAGEANIYEALWRPEEIGIHKASQLIVLLQKGLATLRAEPNRFKEFNPANGWGDYEGLVQFVEQYLSACEEYPDADVYVSR